MKKRLLGLLISGLVLVNLLNITQTESVLADTNVEKKVNVEDFYTDRENIVENEIIVKYKSEENKSKILKYFFGSKNNEVKIEKIKVGENEQLEDRIEELENDPNVELIQPNYKYEKFDVSNKVENNTVQAMGAISSVSDKQWYLQTLKIPDVWSVSTGKGVTVAVIDTGIDTRHEDLVGKVIGGKDFTGIGSYEDNNGHGTLVAGIIAADRENNIGVSGIAYDAKLLSVKVLNKDGVGDTNTIANGIKWAADNGAKILNISLGTGKDDAILKGAVDYAVSKGCILISASGNLGFQGVNYPAAYDNVIAVGATNQSNQLCYFSNFGKEVDVVAPGANIYSTVPNGIFGTKYLSAEGTSVATGMVSGQVALMLSKEPQLTVTDIQDKIKEYSNRLLVDSPNQFYGSGIFNVKAVLTGVFDNITTGYEDDNIPSNPRGIYNSKPAFICELNPVGDVDWYKLQIPDNTVAKITMNTADKNLWVNIFSDSLYFPDRFIQIGDRTEFYISNHYQTRDFYLKVFSYSEQISSCAIDILYLPVDHTSIPKDQTLKYSIDNPSQKKVITGDTLDISGWALSKYGINKVEALVDNRGIEIDYNLNRPDVFGAFPAYGNKQSGFAGNLDISDLPYGNHELTLMFTDERGIVSFSDTVKFTTINTLKYSVDTVRPGMDATGNTLSLSGWALSKAWIAKIEAVIDGGKTQALNYGLARTDVYNAFRDYNNSKSGFSGNMDIKEYAYGPHTLQLKVTYISGRVELTPAINFNIRGTLKTTLDSVKEWDLVTSSSLNVSGWAISKSGIEKVEAIIDDRTPVQLKYGVSRIDVYNAFKDYNNKSAGFSGSVDLTGLEYGNHFLKVKVTEAGGKVTFPVGIWFDVKNSISNMDSPGYNKTFSGKFINVSGWALSKSGIKKVEVVVDGQKTYQQIEYGLNRPDVYNAYKQYNSQACGFSGTIDISKLYYGSHYFNIIITDGVGRTQSVAFVPFDVEDSTQYSIDTPQAGRTEITNTLEVGGWALSKRNVVKVEALIDGVPQDLKYGLSRTDVYNAYKEYNNKTSGFNGKVDISKLPYGTHSLAIRITDASGFQKVSETIKFNVQSTLKYNIDTPTQGKLITGDVLNVSGWALNKSKITKVQALVDGVPYDLKYGVSRPDVYNAFKDYNNGTAGFNGTVDISKLDYYKHKLVLVFTDSTGRTINSNEVIFNRQNTLKYSIDTLQNGITVTGNTLNIGGWALSKAGISKVTMVINSTVYECEYNISRPDVYNAFKDYNNQKAGFRAALDISNLTTGTYHTQFRIVDGNGIETSTDPWIMYVKK
ncbi:S8 family peptidase [Clostridium cellulovorans]|uniref:Peptidase S8 and S53 subtilisin kexin sedolisin n=1 Tax=Clostridium cellulovorans (strain ATCC 35296 / DSM 3052 / OCM 3 / 743B) TaxID=573061 RepID=D9SMB6_CLOC7|nr:S8 family peptidase [Clostridium cellulovorans]ADL53772.1 peptidase S8 and S53 subtilisin kexin sedolisin [Clostridium cellulovorans 743B]